MNLLRPLANLVGYDIVKKHKTLKLQWHLESLLDDLKINTVIDAGANIGQYGKFLRKIGFSGEIHSFEPVKRYYDQLLDASKNDDNWFAYHYALGREEGSQDINVNQSMSSFHEFSDDYPDNHTQNIGRNIETVKISTLDIFITKLFSKNIDDKKIYLKMDTQGFDLEVFMGGLNNMAAIQALQSEVALKKLYKNMPGFSESIDAYSNHGFDITGFFPVSRNKKSKVIIELDCVMVNASVVEKFI